MSLRHCRCMLMTMWTHTHNALTETTTTEWGPLMSMMRLELLLCRITPKSGRIVALSWIGLLVFLLRVLGFLLTNLRSVGVDVGGVMLLEFELRVRYRLAGPWASAGCSKS